MKIKPYMRRMRKPFFTGAATVAAEFSPLIHAPRSIAWILKHASTVKILHYIVVVDFPGFNEYHNKRVRLKIVGGYLKWTKTKQKMVHPSVRQNFALASLNISNEEI